MSRTADDLRRKPIRWAARTAMERRCWLKLNVLSKVTPTSLSEFPSSTVTPWNFTGENGYRRRCRETVVACDFDGSNFTRQVEPHSDSAFTPDWNSVHLAGTSSMDGMRENSVVSSAYEAGTVLAGSTSGTSFTYTMNSVGPRMPPWGTPAVTGRLERLHRPQWLSEGIIGDASNEGRSLLSNEMWHA